LLLVFGFEQYTRKVANESIRSFESAVLMTLRFIFLFNNLLEKGRMVFHPPTSNFTNACIKKFNSRGFGKLVFHLLSIPFHQSDPVE
jgi:hypothetical protein